MNADENSEGTVDRRQRLEHPRVRRRGQLEPAVFLRDGESQHPDLRKCANDILRNRLSQRQWMVKRTAARAMRSKFPTSERIAWNLALPIAASRSASYSFRNSTSDNVSPLLLTDAVTGTGLFGSFPPTRLRSAAL